MLDLTTFRPWEDVSNPVIELRAQLFVLTGGLKVHLIVADSPRIVSLISRGV